MVANGVGSPSLLQSIERLQQRRPDLSLPLYSPRPRPRPRPRVLALVTRLYYLLQSTWFFHQLARKNYSSLGVSLVEILDTVIIIFWYCPEDTSWTFLSHADLARLVIKFLSFLEHCFSRAGPVVSHNREIHGSEVLISTWFSRHGIRAAFPWHKPLSAATTHINCKDPYTFQEGAIFADRSQDSRNFFWWSLQKGADREPEEEEEEAEPMACHGHGVRSYSSRIPENQERVSLETATRWYSSNIYIWNFTRAEASALLYCEEQE
ncbi:hypothetical protein KQX54_004711 [Cotesia glomerata]|uniref:Uncharacterized protein n=1 Tax=Cotesia glomerata TaxID=32391 RepID=A0AAV7HXS9_COTGL|nr:hypothetical protein KQX54_004711 [Cotesia glomerata]